MKVSGEPNVSFHGAPNVFNAMKMYFKRFMLNQSSIIRQFVELGKQFIDITSDLLLQLYDRCETETETTTCKHFQPHQFVILKIVPEFLKFNFSTYI